MENVLSHVNDLQDNRLSIFNFLIQWFSTLEPLLPTKVEYEQKLITIEQRCNFYLHKKLFKKMKKMLILTLSIDNP